MGMLLGMTSRGGGQQDGRRMIGRSLFPPVSLFAPGTRSLPEGRYYQMDQHHRQARCSKSGLPIRAQGPLIVPLLSRLAPRLVAACHGRLRRYHLTYGSEAKRPGACWVSGALPLPLSGHRLVREAVFQKCGPIMACMNQGRPFSVLHKEQVPSQTQMRELPLPKTHDRTKRSQGQHQRLTVFPLSESLSILSSGYSCGPVVLDTLPPQPENRR